MALSATNCGRRLEERSDSDTVRAERAGWLGATSELRDSDSLKTASERVHRRRPGFVSGVRQTPVPNRLGADHRIEPSRRRHREHAPRRGRFSAQRSGSPETTGSIGTDERTIDESSQPWVHDGGSPRGFRTSAFTRRFTTKRFSAASGSDTRRTDSSAREFTDVS